MTFFSFEEIFLINQNIIESKWEPDIILSVNRGGCVPGVYLSHYKSVAHKVLDFKGIDNTTIDLYKSVLDDNKNILVVDDINDTGETFNYINKNFGGEDRVRTAAIIHNAPSKFEKLNYYCYGIDKDVLPCWIVFPWE